MKKFFDELSAKLREIEAIRCDDEVILHATGEIATDEESEIFIKNTNAKYYGETSDKLLGNFAEVRMGYNGKANFVRFDLDSFKKIYEDYGWEPVIKEATGSIAYAKHVSGPASNIIDSLTNYFEIRSKLIVRPLNYDNNKESLRGMVYRIFGDIALVLYAIVLDDKENSALNTLKVPEIIFKEWGISIDKAIDDAMINTAVYAGARAYTNIMNIENEPDENAAIMSSKFQITKYAEHCVPLVTTSRKTNGAIAIFYPEVKEKLAELFGGSFYVAFTSIHECMLHKEGTIEPTSIRRHIRATNRAFGSEETLSDNVYYYNADTNSFGIVVE